MGSGVVRRLTGLEVRDAVSGFRAISKGAAIRLNIFSRFSYTIEMLIQAARKDMKIVSVPVDINEKTRESRLFKNSFDFIGRQVTTLIRMYSMYQPLKVFFYLGTLFSIIGLITILRFTYFYFTSGGSGYLQSLILGGVFLLMGFVTYLFGLLADLISFNRQLSEKALEKIIKLELDRKSTESQSNKSKD